MNSHRYLVIGALSLAAFAAHAREPATRIVLSCPISRTPNLQVVGEIVGTANTWAAYHARERLIELAKQACKRGADYVNIVPGNEPAHAVAQRDLRNAVEPLN